jgi:hypothetical protein
MVSGIRDRLSIILSNIKMNINEEIAEVKSIIAVQEKRLAELEKQSNELTFEIAPELLEKGNVDWYEAINYCKLLGNGWRLPSRDELKIIYNSDNDLNENSTYWSATRGNNDRLAFNQSMYNGDQFISDKSFSSNEYRVRPIRDIIRPNLSFEVVNKSTEIQVEWDSVDKHCKPLGLSTTDELPFEISPKSCEKQCNWYEAFEYAEFVDQGWRIPTIDDLKLIFQNRKGTNMELGVYWTKNVYGHTALGINMLNGLQQPYGKEMGNNYIRLIRNKK